MASEMVISQNRGNPHYIYIYKYILQCFQGVGGSWGECVHIYIYIYISQNTVVLIMGTSETSTPNFGKTPIAEVSCEQPK